MMILSAALASLLGLLLSAKIVLLVWRIRRNQQTAQQFRRHLHERLGALPLARMLDSREVETRRFLNDQRVVDIESQLRTCTGCEETPRCRALVRSATDWTFCPLDEVMLRLRLAAS